MRRASLAIALSVTLTSASAAAEDPYRGLQWGLDKVEAPAAWSESRGEGAVIALIDTGVDDSHPDLVGRLGRGTDLVDDDDDASDRNGHGTLVAGIIAARVGNDIGVASVAPRATVLPVRVLDDAGSGKSDTVAAGIRWAIERRVDVINLSLANDPPAGSFGEVFQDPSVDDAIRDAAAEGIAVIVAAGNDAEGGRSETSYDATVPGVLVVGATTNRDAPAAYGHYGTGLDLVAPGGGSPDDPSDEACTAKNAIVSTWWDPAEKRSDYGGGCGTSMAVGFVSGAAALLAAQGFTNRTIASRLIATVDDLGPKGWDNRFGAGRLNVRRALGVPLASTEAPPTEARPEPKDERDVAIANNAETGVSPEPSRSRASPEGPFAPVAEGSTSPATPTGPSSTLAGFLLVGVLLGHGFRLFARLRRSG